MALDSGGNVMKTYIYENAQIIAQRDGGQSANEYFYVKDRLGSVRQLINASGDVVRNYTYSPFGQLLESGTAQNPPNNPFMFTGQWFDDEISQYYLRARMYDPVLMRFTARDPVFGKFKEPMTLHEYLYCLNDPVNQTDPTGEFLLDLLFGQSTAAKMRAQTAALSGRALGLAARVYTAAYVRAVAINLYIQSHIFRMEGHRYGKDLRFRYHFHLPWGPGLGKHHLPEQFPNWWKNFIAVLSRLFE